MKFEVRELDAEVEFSCPVYTSNDLKVAPPGHSFDLKSRQQLLDWGYQIVKAPQAPESEQEVEAELPAEQHLTEKLAPGSVFDCPVFTPDGRRLLDPFTPLFEEQLELLKKWGVEKLWAEAPPLSEETKEKYLRQARRTQVGSVAGAGDDSADTEAVSSPQTPVYCNSEEKSEVRSAYRETLARFEKLLDSFARGQLDEIDPFYDLVRNFAEYLKQNQLLVLYLLNTEASPGDEYIYRYNLHTALLGMILGKEQGLNNREVWRLGVGGLIHDTGMLKIPQNIRKKPQKLSPDERREMKKHLVEGLRVLNGMEEYHLSLQKVMTQHHEQYDGTGYPRGLKGEEIHPHARIINLAMTYVALNQARFHRPSLGVKKSVRKVIYEKRKQYDPDVLRAFLDVLGVFPPGNLVRLNTGELALVREAKPGNPLNPLVRVLSDSEDNRLKKPYRLELARCEKSVTDVVDSDEFDLDVYGLV